jgi:hypothetical protein
VFNDKYKRNSIDFVKQKIINKGYIPLFDEYKNNKQKLLLETKEGYKLISSFDRLRKSNPNIFDPSNPYTITNIKLWLKLNNKEVELLSNKYENNHKLLQWKCLKNDCKEVFSMSWNNIKKGELCPKHKNERISRAHFIPSINNNLLLCNPNLCKEWNYDKNKKRPEEYCVNSHEKVWWKCKRKNCEYEWESSIYNRNKGRGCPICNQSKGEQKINRYLKIKCLKYDIQKKFLNLIGLGNKLLSYDFYLPDYNLLIEYQERQHKEFIEGFHKTIENFEKQKEHDKRKREYAENNNIQLLEIWYWDYKNIEKILDKWFKENISKQEEI